MVATYAQGKRRFDCDAAETEAVEFYAARHQRTVAKRVQDVVAGLLLVKEAGGKSLRYLSCELATCEDENRQQISGEGSRH